MIPKQTQPSRSRNRRRSHLGPLVLSFLLERLAVFFHTLYTNKQNALGFILGKPYSKIVFDSCRNLSTNYPRYPNFIRLNQCKRNPWLLDVFCPVVPMDFLCSLDCSVDCFVRSVLFGAFLKQIPFPWLSPLGFPPQPFGLQSPVGT